MIGALGLSFMWSSSGLKINSPSLSLDEFDNNSLNLEAYVRRFSWILFEQLFRSILRGMLLAYRVYLENITSTLISQLIEGTRKIKEFERKALKCISKAWYNTHPLMAIIMENEELQLPRLRKEACGSSYGFKKPDLSLLCRFPLWNKEVPWVAGAMGKSDVMHFLEITWLPTTEK